MSQLPRVYVTRRLPQPAMDLLSQHAQVAIWPGEQPPPRPVLLKELPDIDALVTLPTDRIDATLLAAAPYLRVVSNYAADCDNIDVAAATRRNVMVAYTPNVLTETVADYALALMLAAARRVGEGEQYAKAGHWRAWSPELLLGRDLFGATLGIVGLGRIGQAVARRAQGFGMRIIYAGPNRKHAAEQALGAIHTPLEQLLAESDLISLHCPLNDETYHLIDRDALERVKPTAILVNTARGQVVDTRALVDALRAQPIVAALDVTDPEPLPGDHPLLILPNAIVTPQLASATAQTRTRMALIAVQNTIAALAGDRPSCVINPEVWGSKVITVGGS